MTPGWKTGIQSGMASTDLDLTKIGQARNKILDIKLTQVFFFVNFTLYKQSFFSLSFSISNFILFSPLIL